VQPSQPIDTGGCSRGTVTAAEQVGQQKLEKMNTSGEIKRAFAASRVAR
jgi:hypothetical protein